MASEDAQDVGVHHHDEREPLAYAYDGTVLVAVGYREEIVEHWEKATDYTVTRTPSGERATAQEDQA